MAEALGKGRRRSSQTLAASQVWCCCNPILVARYQVKCRACCRSAFSCCRKPAPHNGHPRGSTDSSGGVEMNQRGAGRKGRFRNDTSSGRRKVLDRFGDEQVALSEQQKIQQAALFVRVRGGGLPIPCVCVAPVMVVVTWACYTQDACAERPVRIRTASTCSTAVYRAYYNGWMRAFVVMVVIIHLLLVLFEPNRKDGESYPGSFSRSAIWQTSDLLSRDSDYHSVLYVQSMQRALTSTLTPTCLCGYPSSVWWKPRAWQCMSSTAW